MHNLLILVRRNIKTEAQRAVAPRQLGGEDHKISWNHSPTFEVVSDTGMKTGT